MTIRTSQRTIRFDSPFQLAGMDSPHPAGVYTLETDEELLQDLSFPAYRRTATRLFLPVVPGSTILGEVVSIDPLELEAAQARDDAAAPGTGVACHSAAGTDMS